MGNRAIISYREDGQDKQLAPSIYLHWNGGRDSVEAFLEASQTLGIRGNDELIALVEWRKSLAIGWVALFQWVWVVMEIMQLNF